MVLAHRVLLADPSVGDGGSAAAASGRSFGRSWKASGAPVGKGSSRS